MPDLPARLLELLSDAAARSSATRYVLHGFGGPPGCGSKTRRVARTRLAALSERSARRRAGRSGLDGWCVIHVARVTLRAGAGLVRSTRRV
jgi:hypothetical protein